VPLPRSKLPAAEKEKASPATSPVKESASKFFQRSKTDLGSDALSKYKAKRSPGPGSKYPAPRVPVFNRPVPQKRSVVSTSPTISEVPASESKPAPSQKASEVAPSSRPLLKEKPLFSTFKTNKKADPSKASKAASKAESRMSRAASEGDILGQLIEEETALNANETVMKQETEPAPALDNVNLKKPRSEPLTITSEPLVDKTSHDSVSDWIDRSW
jgi:hypothetical protein